MKQFITITKKRKLFCALLITTCSYTYSQTLANYCGFNTDSSQQLINSIYQSGVLSSKNETECKTYINTCTYSQNTFNFKNESNTITINAANNISITTGKCEISFTNPPKQTHNLSEYHTSVNILNDHDNTVTYIATISNTDFRPRRINKVFAVSNIKSVSLPDNILAYDFSIPYECIFKAPGSNYSNPVEYKTTCSGFIDVTLDKSKEIPDHNKWTKNVLIPFRKQLTDGSKTNCGIVIEVKPNIVKVQFADRVNFEMWINKESLFPQYDEWGSLIQCKTTN